jgi:hypothetical protein
MLRSQLLLLLLLLLELLKLVLQLLLFAFHFLLLGCVRPTLLPMFLIFFGFMERHVLPG